MAKLTIRITHVKWRDGRPRFEPSPTMRAEGYIVDAIAQQIHTHSQPSRNQAAGTVSRRIVGVTIQ